MRAIEAQRYLVRAANDGISAVVGPHGEVIARAPEFTPYVLRATITARSGLPPYVYVGNWPVMLLALLGVAVAALRQRSAHLKSPPAGHNSHPQDPTRDRCQRNLYNARESIPDID